MGTVWRGSDLKVLGLCLSDDLTQKTNTCDDQKPTAADKYSTLQYFLHDQVNLTTSKE